MMGRKLTPYHDRDPEARWIVDRCPRCGQRKRMKSTDDVCGACRDGEAPRMQQAMKPALDVTIETAKKSFGVAELRYLSEGFARAADELAGKV